MRKRFWLLAVLAVLVSAGLVVSAKQTSSQPPQQPITLNADTIFNLVNNERTKAGLKPLVRDTRLDATAKVRTDDMVTRHYFSHFDPSTKANLVNVGSTYPGLCKNASENIGMTNGFIDDNYEQLYGVGGWINSKPHKEAILDARYDTTGVAISDNKVVQHFCDL
jgi:uncharacterized protein YkwD